MTWVVELLDDRVQNELEALSVDMQARFRSDCGINSELWPGTGSRAACKASRSSAVGNAMRGRDGIARAIYVTATGRRVVDVRAFIKKTQKTPRREIHLALERAREVKDR